jgi:putative DNA primase/helicase
MTKFVPPLKNNLWGHIFEPLTPEELNDYDQIQRDITKSKIANASKGVITPVPESAPEPDFTHYKLGKPTMVWPYHDQNGDLMFYVCRFEKEGKKEIRAYSFVKNSKGQTQWSFKWMPNNRPLYNLPKLLHRDEVFVTEGEKAADAAAQLLPSFAVTTSSGGASATAMTDFSPLKGKDVYIWRDVGKAGEKYEEDFARRALGVGAKNVFVLYLESFSGDIQDGWDLADALEEGWKPEDVYSMLRKNFYNFNDRSQVYPGLYSGAEFFPFESNENGLYYKHYTEKGDGCVYHISTPVEVLAKTRDFEGKNWGYQISVTNSDGGKHTEIIPGQDFANSGKDVISRLLSLGLVVKDAPKAEKRLMQYIQECPSMNRARVVDHPGWHNGRLVTTSKIYGFNNGEQVIMENKNLVDFKMKGSLEDWKFNVAAFCAGNSRFVFSISCAMAAPLLELLSAETSGFHFRGDSSIGKSTLLNVSASVAGVERQQWRNTDNFAETLCSSFNSFLLPIDELAQLDAKAAPHIAYMFGNGRGKGRMTQSGQARKTYKWRLMFLSSGEISMQQKLEELGSKFKETSGQKNRMADIPADTGSGLGALETLHQFKTSKALIDHLNDATHKYYGTAGDAIFDYYANNQEEVTIRAQELIAEFESRFAPKDASSQVLRVLSRFAVVAAGGAIATEEGVLPWDKDEAFKGVGICFNAWLQARGGNESAEHIQGFKNLKENLERYEAKHFEFWTTYTGYDEVVTANTYDCWGWKKRNEVTGEYDFYVTSTGFKELCGGVTSDAFKNFLTQRGWLEKQNEGFMKQVRLPNKKRKWLYMITPQDES